MKTDAMKIMCAAAVAATAAMACGCAASRQSAAEPVVEAPAVVAAPGHVIGSETRGNRGEVNRVPRAVVYRMSGDYAANVPVTLTAGGELLSYPAPTDISPASKPLPLADGWWLDRRGVSERTVFTRYTYEEYSALPQAPSPQALLEAVIPGACVTALRRLPLTLSEAMADTAAVNRLIEADAAMSVQPPVE